VEDFRNMIKLGSLENDLRSTEHEYLSLALVFNPEQNGTSCVAASPLRRGHAQSDLLVFLNLSQC